MMLLMKIQIGRIAGIAYITRPYLLRSPAIAGKYQRNAAGKTSHCGFYSVYIGKRTILFYRLAKEKFFPIIGADMLFMKWIEKLVICWNGHTSFRKRTFDDKIFEPIFRKDLLNSGPLSPEILKGSIP